MERHGIKQVATYDARALDLEVGVMSADGRRHLEAIMKLDQLMLQPLEIHEVLTTDDIDRQRSATKRQVRGVAQRARHLAGGLRRRMRLKEEASVAGSIEPALVAAGRRTKRGARRHPQPAELVGPGTVEPPRRPSRCWVQGRTVACPEGVMRDV